MGMFVIYLCISMFINFSFAQDLAEENLVSLVIESPKIPQEFNETERNQTGKIILKATTKVRGYQIILGDFDPAKKTKFQVHVVDMEALPDDRGSYTLTARLFDEKTKKLINKVSYTFIEKNSYFRELERLMNELFLPVDLEKLREPKTEDNKKKAPKVKLPVPLTEIEAADLNFKQRIMSLKSGVDSKIKEISDKNNVVDKKDNKDALITPVKALAKVSENSLETIAPAKPPLNHPMFNNMKSIHKAGILYIATTTNSINDVSYFGNKIELDIDTSIKYAGVIYSYQRPIKKGHDHFWQSELAFAQVRSDAEVEFAPYAHANTAYGYFWRRTGMFIRGGLDVDTFSFASLPVEGQGVKASNIRVVNFLVGAHWAGELFSQPLILGADFTRAFYALSDNEDVKGTDVAGSYIRFNTTIADLYFNLNLKFEYYIADYDFSKERTLTTSTQGFGIHVNYVF